MSIGSTQFKECLITMKFHEGEIGVYLLRGRSYAWCEELKQLQMNDKEGERARFKIGV